MSKYTYYGAYKRRSERLLRKTSVARSAKAAKREALGAVATVTAGWVVFGGLLFGRHKVRIKCREDAPHRLYLEVDGTMTCIKSQRGTRALLMRRIARELKTT